MNQQRIPYCVPQTSILQLSIESSILEVSGHDMNRHSGDPGTAGDWSGFDGNEYNL